MTVARVSQAVIEVLRGAAATAETIFIAQVPSNRGIDGITYEMGVKFQSSIAGNVTGIRFWRDIAQDAATITGRLWSAGGSLLGSVVIPAGAPDAWNSALFASPIAIQANTTYVASTNIGGDQHYAFGAGGLASSISNGQHLSTVVGSNGVYSATAGTFPDQSFGDANYWRDVIFEAGSASSSTVTVASGGLTFAADGRLCVTSNETPAATSPFNGAWAFRASDGAAYYLDLGASAVPATAVFNKGLAFSPQGALYGTSNTSGTFVAADGRVARADGALLVVAASPTLGTDPATNGIYRKMSNGATFIQVL